MGLISDKLACQACARSSLDLTTDKEFTDWTLNALCFKFLCTVHLSQRLSNRTRVSAKFVSLAAYPSQAGDTRIPLPRKSQWTPQKIVDCKVGLCTSLRIVAELLQQYSA